MGPGVHGTTNPCAQMRANLKRAPLLIQEVGAMDAWASGFVVSILLVGGTGFEPVTSCL
jgi:hypothetical protein